MSNEFSDLNLANSSRGFVTFALCAFALIVFTAVDVVWSDFFLRQNHFIFVALNGHETLIGVWFWPFDRIFVGLIFAASVGGLFYAKRKVDALLAFYLYGATLLIVCVLKMVYRDPRPCHVDLAVALEQCRCSFGKVSGHSCLATASGFFLCAIYTDDLRFAWRLASRAAVGFLALNVGLSRISFGHHSWNQVLLGWLWGLALFALFSLFRNVCGDSLERAFMGERGFEAAKLRLTGAVFAVLLALNAIAIRQWFFDERLTPIDGLGFTRCYRRLCRWSFMEKELGKIAFCNWLLPMTVCWAALDLPKTLPNPFFQIQSFQSALFFAKRTFVFALVASPIIAAFFLPKFVSGIALYVSGLLFSALFSAFFFVLMPVLLEAFEVDLSGDFFSGGRTTAESNAREFESNV